MTTAAATALEDLRAALPAEVLVTEPAALEAARADRSGHRTTGAPLAVVEAETADDVVAAVRFAGRHGLDLAVQATGLGATPCSGSTLLVRASRPVEER